MEKNNTINGRTPEEIKRSLKCRAMWGTPDCKMKCDECGTYVPGLNGSIMAAAALALIQQLERERDAAVEDMTELMQLAQFCRHCKHITEDGECTFDFAANKGEPWCWQWRGVQEVE